jgi:carboxypeptidase Q
MFRRKLAVSLLAVSLLSPGFSVFAQTAVGSTAVQPTVGKSVYKAPDEVIAKIKDEGMNRSQVMQTLSYLTDVIGARLTGSDSLKRANEWTRDTMTKWGMQNARLEAWGPFGRGWKLNSFAAQINAPYNIPLIAYPKAWSPSTNGVLNADVVYLEAKDDAALEKYKGQLKGKIVLVSDIREVKANFTPLGTRYKEDDLAKMAAFDPSAPVANNRQGNPQAMQQRMLAFVFAAKRANFVMQEGAAMIIDNSRNGSGGTIFVAQASVAQEVPSNPMGMFGRNRLSPWQKEAESKMLPQVTLASEHYNRLVRMIQQGEKLKMSVDLQAQYLDGDDKAYNTIAEIPGTDPKLKDEVVMLGGHLDSWHAGTGATDNGAGVAVAMEAARIIQSLGLKPRRTIRVALWTGEEQGLFGSRAYVKQHFGEMQGGGGNQFGPPDPNAPKPTLVKGADYEKLSAYYNLDNGTGKIRGVYMQGNPLVKPIFEQWLTSFKDMGASTLTLQNTGGTDHLSFDGIGLPGFQFIQDEIEYDTLTHHSNQDVYDRIQADDMKESATIMAAFVYQTAMMDEKMPRKPMK